MPARRFVVIGLGNFGTSVAEALYKDGHDVIAVDTDEDRVDAVAAHVSRAAVVDARQRDALEQAGAGEADAAIISTGDDITASMLATLALLDLGVEELYAIVVSRDHGRIVEHMGVEETIFPERESAFNLSNRLSDHAVVDYVRMAGGLSVQEMVVPAAWQGQTLRHLSLRDRFAITVVAIHDTETDALAAPPDPDQPLAATDTLLVAGRGQRLREAKEIGEDT
ncbi:MAG: potassium transporter TrkA [Bacteroidetes bacterium QH_2_67_10]|nr:MAG: potassium transporter TrkA [Bacteroidetes bacterium QH_2_67_10]